MQKRTVIVLLLLLAAAVAAIPLVFFLRGEYDRRYPPISFKDVAEDRAPLIDWIESYVSVDEFVEQLASRSLPYEIERPDPAAMDTNRPPFDVTTIRIQSFSHLKFAGELVVEFFNNRLISVRYYPSDIVSYRARFRTEMGINLEARVDARPVSNTRVWSAIDFQGRVYVGWEDVRLEKEISLWIELYS